MFAFNKLKHHLFYLFLFSILSIYILYKEIYGALFLIIFVLILFLKDNKTLFIVSCILLIVFTIRISYRNKIFNNFKGSSNIENQYAYILYTVKKENYQLCYVRLPSISKSYYFTYQSKEKIYTSGDVIEISGTIKKFNQNHTKNGYNEYDYSKQNGILGKIENGKVKIIKNTFNRYFIHELFVNKINEAYP